MIVWDRAATLPSLEELRETDPHVAFIGPLSQGKQAREWALVLQSQHISYVMHPAMDGWVLRISPIDEARALEAISLYEAENENWPPPRVKDKPRHDSSLAIPFAIAAMVLFFLYATGPVNLGSRWFSAGRADAVKLLEEPWRMVTALTLHADIQHVLGNAISGAIFGSMVSRRIGPGGALLSIIVAGALGNAANALYHLPEGHRSIGASTAVFAAVGILAAVQTVRDWRGRQDRPRYGFVDFLAPVIGGLALLGSLGAGGGNTDVYAHGFGFGAGVVVGLVVALIMRRRDAKPSQVVQLASLTGAAALVVGAWTLAFV